MNPFVSDLRAMLIAVAVSIPAVAAPGPVSPAFEGTWKLSPRASTYGGVLTIAAQPRSAIPGTYNLSFRDMQGDFLPDGKAKPRGKATLESWTQVSDKLWRRLIVETVSASGLKNPTPKELLRNDFHLSVDGRILTSTITDARSGSPFRLVDTFRREGSGSGIPGRWRMIAHDDPAYNVFTLAFPTAQNIAFSLPGLQESVAGPASGEDLFAEFPDHAAGISTSFVPRSLHTIEFTDKTDGLIDRTGTYVVSPDGKTIVLTQWLPRLEKEKDVLVYKRM